MKKVKAHAAKKPTKAQVTKMEDELLNCCANILTLAELLTNSQPEEMKSQTVNRVGDMIGKETARLQTIARQLWQRMD